MIVPRCIRHIGAIIFFATASSRAQLVPPQICTGETIGIPDLPGGEILQLQAYPVTDYSTMTIPLVHVPGGVWSSLNFCNVSISYTHPGWDDFVTITMWLPLDNWNGRFQGSGGAGWFVGLPADTLAPATSEGYAVGSTDGGHTIYTQSAAPWALSGSGQVDQGQLQNFASVAVNDLSIIGKQIVESFFGVPAHHSYWAGCSTGGRQGLALAQMYPEAFDGIMAAAPSNFWPTLLVSDYWPQQVMNRLGVFPESCEFEAIRMAAIQACDGLDGLVDGILSAPEQCAFNAMSLVGQAFSCNGQPRQFSAAAATIANFVWDGPRDSAGVRQWYGSVRGTPFFNTSDPITPGLTGTTCQGSVCTGAPFPISVEWIQYFVAKDPTFDPAQLSYDQYFQVLQASQQEYNNILGISSPDLSAFKARGGKLITWHGLTDQLISAEQSEQYYNSVLSVDPGTEDFFRFFKAPGVGHCNSGPGPSPIRALDSVVRWVEEGIAPDILPALSQTGDGTVRPLCPFPLRQQYIGGDARDPGSFSCAGT